MRNVITFQMAFNPGPEIQTFTTRSMPMVAVEKMSRHRRSVTRWLPALGITCCAEDSLTARWTI